MHKSLNCIYFKSLGDVSIILTLQAIYLNMIDILEQATFNIIKFYSRNYKAHKITLVHWKFERRDSQNTHRVIVLYHISRKKAWHVRKIILRNISNKLQTYNLVYNFFSHFSSDISKTFLCYKLYKLILSKCPLNARTL